MARKKIPENYEKIKQSIINAAIETMVKNSITNFSMIDVAESVGVTKAAIYWYFPSKNALVEEVAQEIYLTYIGHARQLSCSNLNSWDKLKLLIVGVDDNEESIESVFMCVFPIKFFLDYYSEENPIKSMVQKGYREYNQIVCQILSEGVQRGEFNAGFSIQEMARFITGSIDGLAFQNLLISSEKAELSRLFIYRIMKQILMPADLIALDTCER